MSRVLFWSTTFWPHLGGVEVLGAQLVRVLVERGHDVTVICRRDTENLPDDDEVVGARVIRRPFRQAVEGGDPDAVFRLQGEVAALKRSVAPDVLHLYHLGPDLLFHRLTLNAAPAPTLVTLHQAFDDGAVAGGQTLRRTLEEADWLAACSQSALDDVRRQLPEVTPRSEVVANALPPPSAETTPLPDGPPVVLFVGRVVPQKGFDLGLLAIAALRDDHPDMQVLIAGDGVDRPALEQQATDLGLDDIVRFTGWADPPGVRRLMEAARVGVMPSRYEPFGLVAVEAAQMGRPVVAFAVDGLPEAVADGETGLLVPPEDVPGLTGAVASLLRDRELAARLGEAGRRRTRSAEAWEAHVAAYESLYARLAGHG